MIGFQCRNDVDSTRPGAVIHGKRKRGASNPLTRMPGVKTVVAPL
jgi:hypothetical protein